MSNIKYPQSVFLPEIHEKIQLFYSRSQELCFGIKKTDLVDLKQELGITNFYQLENGTQVRLFKLMVTPPYITDVEEYLKVEDLDLVDEKWSHRRIK